MTKTDTKAKRAAKEYSSPVVCSKIILHYDRHHGSYSEEYDTVKEAANAVWWMSEYNAGMPLRIIEGEKTLWKFEWGDKGEYLEDFAKRHGVITS